MKVEISSLCEYASEHAGRLTIIDTFDTIVAMKIPWRAYFYYVAKIDANDVRKEYETIKVVIRNDGGDNLFEVSNPFGKHQLLHKFNLVAGFKGLIFDKAGEYKLSVYFDKELVIEHLFKVELRKDEH